MPIVINEIAISVEVAAGNTTQGPATSPAGNLSQEEIVRECVEKVLEILKQKNER